METTTANTKALADIIMKCNSYSMNLQLTPQERSTFLIEGKRLRGQLMNLLSAQFDRDSSLLGEANSKLTKVSATLAQSATVLAHAAQTLTDIRNLVGTLDKLLSTALSFV